MRSVAYAELLGEAMQWGVSVDRYQQLSYAVAQCLNECDATNLNRVAMWCAQIGHESAGLLYMEELADGSAYEGREDLGNTEPGDGCRFKGRGPIMVTGRHNYTVCSEWAFSKGLVPSPTFFVDFPEEMASDVLGFIGTTWYWMTQRPMNEAADAGDIDQATYYVNGGYNGLDDRTQRWNHCLSMGERIMGLTDQAAAGAPPPPPPPPVEKVLAYDHSIVPQETGYWCGPASTQVVLNAQGIFVSEQQLANEMGSDEDGTDDMTIIANTLRGYVPQADYRDIHISDRPANPAAAGRAVGQPRQLDQRRARPGVELGRAAVELSDRDAGVAVAQLRRRNDFSLRRRDGILRSSRRSGCVDRRLRLQPVRVLVHVRPGREFDPAERLRLGGCPRACAGPAAR